MKIIAHRGFSEVYPENTLLAFQKAIESGADGIETDLRLSLDGEIVLFHDSTLKRLADVDTEVEKLTLQALKEFDVGFGESIPTLNELISLAAGKVTLILEIKYHPKTYKKLCEVLVGKIDRYKEWIEVSCFSDRALEYLYALNKDIRLHKLIEEEYLLRDHELDKKYDYIFCFDIAVALHKTVLETGLIRRYKIILWTVENEDLTMERSLGLYGVMVNNVRSHKNP